MGYLVSIIFIRSKFRHKSIVPYALNAGIFSVPLNVVSLSRRLAPPIRALATLDGPVLNAASRWTHVRRTLVSTAARVPDLQTDRSSAIVLRRSPVRRVNKLNPVSFPPLALCRYFCSMPSPRLVCMRSREVWNFQTVFRAWNGLINVVYLSLRICHRRNTVFT